MSIDYDLYLDTTIDLQTLQEKVVKEFNGLLLENDWIRRELNGEVVGWAKVLVVDDYIGGTRREDLGYRPQLFVSMSPERQLSEAGWYDALNAIAMTSVNVCMSLARDAWLLLNGETPVLHWASGRFDLSDSWHWQRPELWDNISAEKELVSFPGPL